MTIDKMEVLTIPLEVQAAVMDRIVRLNDRMEWDCECSGCEKLGDEIRLLEEWLAGNLVEIPVKGR